MKSVMLSIRPQWCELIALGKKTIEARKARPKLETPFKCYIYCTQGEEKWLVGIIGKHPSEKLNGNVIGEFVCDHVKMEAVGYIDHVAGYHGLESGTCLTAEQLMEYGKWALLYGWHISDLQIYDKPKELSEFYHYLPDKILDNGDYDCRDGGEIVCMDMPEGGDDCAECPYGGRVYLKRPPQSWCYVEALDAK